MSSAPQDYLVQQFPQILQRLIDFASIPSISVGTSYEQETLKASQWIAEKMTSTGMQNVTAFPTERYPIIYGERLETPECPTVLIYGHYDVQPVEPIDDWNTVPFTPTIKENRIYGRGVSDDKGPLLIALEACEAFHQTKTHFPVNIKFLVEGGEEIGSPGVEKFLQEYQELLACDMVLSADGAMWRPDFPSINIASRGMTTLQFSIQGPAHEVHSGRYGGGIANPLHAISELIAGLHNPDGSIAVEGFYDDVLPINERIDPDKYQYSETQILEETGAKSTFGEKEYGLLERLWLRPTLDVIGMWGGYQESGFKSAIPAVAHAKISSRLVPNQSPLDIQTKIIKHLETCLPQGIQLTVQTGQAGVPAYQIPQNHIGLQIAAQVLESLYGEKPALVRIGATLPISTAFKQHLNADTIFFSFSTADEGFHGPNEFFRLDRLQLGLRAWLEYLTLLGSRYGCE
jgi:acetylornithine deacetylase/succinyl-diaminopimelate desuccinylase-like protein